MSQATHPDRPAPAELANAEVLTEDGGKLRLGTLWSRHAVVLAFVRHFG